MGTNESFGDSSNGFEEEALDAVSNFIRGRSASSSDMVQRFVLIVETIDAEDRWISAFTAPGQKAWDTLGLLEFARNMEKDSHILVGPDEDEDGGDP